MHKTQIQKCALLLCVAMLTGAWTFELFDKPGSEQMVTALQARDAGDSMAAVAAYEQALEEAVDNQTRAKAMTNIASIYLTEEPVAPETAEKAKELLFQAEALGYPRATMVLGEMYRQGQGVAVDYEKAFAYLSQVKTAYPSALISIAEMVTDPQVARDYLAQAVDALEQEIVPSTDATLRMARHFRDGKLVVADPERAEYWYQKAIAADAPAAMMELAAIWAKSGHEPSSEIISLWQRASDLGVDRATLEIGFAYANGVGVTRDKTLAEKYFAEAAEENPENAYRVARWYEERAKNNRSYAAVAADWFKVAAAKGHPEAIMRQARAYWSGEGAPLNRAHARELYRMAAQKGSTKATAELEEREQREHLRKQKRLTQLAEKARRALGRKAEKEAKGSGKGASSAARKGEFKDWLPLAEGGDATAMWLVGEAYIQGNGVEEDAPKGLEWLNKSAAAGNGQAMYSLAQAYSAGIGVASDTKQAYVWYAKAAEAGHPAAQYQLGLGYARGIGVAQDNEKASEWLGKASANGYSAAGEVLQNLKGMKSQ